MFGFYNNKPNRTSHSNLSLALPNPLSPPVPPPSPLALPPPHWTISIVKYVRVHSMNIRCSSVTCNAAWHMVCLLPPLTTIPHGIWKCPLCLPRHFLPHTATLLLAFLSPFSISTLIKILQKNDSLSLIRVSGPPITIYIFLKKSTSKRLFMRGHNLKHKFSKYLERSSPWGNLGLRHIRFSPSGFFLGFSF